MMMLTAKRKTAVVTAGTDNSRLIKKNKESRRVIGIQGLLLQEKKRRRRFSGHHKQKMFKGRAIALPLL